MSEMATRIAIVVVFSSCAIVSLYAMRKSNRYSYLLLGVVLWCLNVVAYTVATGLRAEGIHDIGHEVIRTWSRLVRLHGGIVVLSMSIYYVARRRRP